MKLRISMQSMLVITSSYWLISFLFLIVQMEDESKRVDDSARKKVNIKGSNCDPQNSHLSEQTPSQDERKKGKMWDTEEIMVYYEAVKQVCLFSIFHC